MKLVVAYEGPGYKRQLGFLRLVNNRILWAPSTQEDCDFLKRFVLQAGTRCPVRWRNHNAAQGVYYTQYAYASSLHAEYYHIWTTYLNCHALNGRKFSFYIYNDNKEVSSKWGWNVLNAAHIQADLYNIRMRLGSLRVQCGCGSSYSLIRWWKWWRTRCPACGGHDPLGCLLSKRKESILHMWKQYAENCWEEPDIGSVSLLKPLLTACRRASSLGMTRDRPDCPGDDIQKTIDYQKYYRNAYRSAEVSDAAIRECVHAVRGEPNYYSGVLIKASELMGRSWGYQHGSVWNPTPMFMDNLCARLSHMWSDPIRHVCGVLKQIAVSAAVYRGLDTCYERKLNPSAGRQMYGWIRNGIAAFNAVASLGQSLLFTVPVRLIASGLRQEREHERVKAYNVVVDRVVMAARECIDKCDDAVRNGRQEAVKLTSALCAHALVVLVQSYAQSSVSEQHACVERLSMAVGYADGAASRLKPRTVAGRRRRTAARIVFAVFFVLLCTGVFLCYI